MGIRRYTKRKEKGKDKGEWCAYCREYDCLCTNGGETKKDSSLSQWEKSRRDATGGFAP